MMIKGAYTGIAEPDTANDGALGFMKFKDKSVVEFCSCGRGDLCPNRYYKLIFMDLNMPNVDGFDCTKNIVEYQQDLPVKATIVALTAYTNNNS